VIDNFLELYVSAFLSFAPSAINELYEFPAVLYTESGEAVVFTEEQFTTNSQNLLQQYKSIGVGKIDYEILSESQASNSLKLIAVLWHFKKSNGEVIYSAQTNYLLKNSGNGYKIASVIMVNESTEFSKVAGKKI
jgi:hypothetical protein